MCHCLFTSNSRHWFKIQIFVSILILGIYLCRSIGRPFKKVRATSCAQGTIFDPWVAVWTSETYVKTPFSSESGIFLNHEVQERRRLTSIGIYIDTLICHIWQFFNVVPDKNGNIERWYKGGECTDVDALHRTKRRKGEVNTYNAKQLISDPIVDRFTLHLST